MSRAVPPSATFASPARVLMPATSPHEPALAEGMAMHVMAKRYSGIGTQTRARKGEPRNSRIPTLASLADSETLDSILPPVGRPAFSLDDCRDGGPAERRPAPYDRVDVPGGCPRLESQHHGRAAIDGEVHRDLRRQRQAVEATQPAPDVLRREKVPLHGRDAIASARFDP